MRYYIITPPGVEQPRGYMVVVAGPHQWGLALDSVGRHTAAITTVTLPAGWHELVPDAPHCQDSVDSPVAVLRTRLRPDPRMPILADLYLQAVAAGYGALPTGLAAPRTGHSLRQLRYLHYKWREVFPEMTGEGWRWDERGLTLEAGNYTVTIHHALTTSDHTIGIL